MTDAQRIDVLERQVAAAVAMLAEQNAILARLAFAVFALQCAVADDALPGEHVAAELRPH